MISGKITIEAVAYEQAPHKITSESIEAGLSKTMERLGLQSGLIEGLTGIRERRFWDPGVMPSEAATSAARKVIHKAGVDPGEIGCLINASVCRDYVEPSTACLVHGNLGPAALPITLAMAEEAGQCPAAMLL